MANERPLSAAEADELRRRLAAGAALTEEERRRLAASVNLTEDERRRLGLTLTDEERRRGASVAGNVSDDERRRGAGVGWFGRLYNGWSSLATIGVLGLAGIAIVALMDPGIFLGKSSLVRQSVTSQRWADSSTVYTVNGIDKAGRQATFDIIVLNKDYTWRRGSDTDLLRGTNLMVGNDLDTYIFRPDVRSGLAKASEVVAVGIASQEGDSVPEHARAGRRANTGAGWLKIVTGGAGKISTLNLGQYQTACPNADAGDTSWQRPFMMIGVRNAKPDVNLSEALINAFTGKANLPAPSCYSHFELARAP